MCFDESRMRGNGQTRWRTDATLLRLGHPAMTKSAKRLQRLLWENSATSESPFSRWSVEVSDQISKPCFEVATLRIARNKLREPVLAELDVTTHSFSDGTMMSDGVRANLGQKIDGTIATALQQKIRIAWLNSSTTVQELTQNRTKNWLEDLDHRLSIALSASLADEKKAYEKRMRELKKSTERNENSIERIRIELERWEERSLQLTLEGYRLPKAVAKTEEMKAKLVDAEFKRRRVHVDEQIERLRKEKSRVLEKVTPMRFTRRGAPQVWPLGVRVILPTSEVAS